MAERAAGAKAELQVYPTWPSFEMELAWRREALSRRI